MASTTVGKLTIEHYSRMKVKEAKLSTHRWILFHVFSKDNYHDKRSIILPPSYQYQGYLLRTKDFALSLL